MTQSGIALIDKPSGWTSHDVVAKVRKALGTKKVGHAGTLDPMATGLLVLGINSGTKLLTFLVGADKSYRATIRLGSSTVTDDAEGEIVARASSEALAKVSDSDITNAISKLTGEISQRPSSVSAIKVKGERAYDLVRKGEEVELATRKVTVSKFEILNGPLRSDHQIDLEVIVDCSSGTYVRALARDLGEILGVGGHLTALRRERVGSYFLENANSIDRLESIELTPLAAAACAIMPSRTLSMQEVVDLGHGKRITKEQESGLVAGIGPSGKLIAVLEPKGTDLKSVVVFGGESNG
ncbi:MAG: tRNA pseudouridine(55) synthase TruB [Actinomycetota bacterium]